MLPFSSPLHLFSNLHVIMETAIGKIKELCQGTWYIRLQHLAFNEGFHKENHRKGQGKLKGVSIITVYSAHSRAISSISESTCSVCAWLQIITEAESIWLVHPFSIYTNNITVQFTDVGVNVATAVCTSKLSWFVLQLGESFSWPNWFSWEIGNVVLYGAADMALLGPLLPLYASKLLTRLNVLMWLYSWRK